MKACKQEIELDTILEWTNKLEEYKKYSFSKFTKAKKNNMDTSLYENHLFQKGNIAL